MTQPIINAANQTAIRYYQPTPVLVKNTPSGKEYYFNVVAAISMAWVDAEDVQNIIDRRKTCCGGNKRVLFSYANDAAVRIWGGASR
jgi:hypothetical protein